MNKTDTALCSHKLIKKIDSKKKIIQILTILQTVKNATKSQIQTVRRHKMKVDQNEGLGSMSLKIQHFKPDVTTDNALADQK